MAGLLSSRVLLSLVWAALAVGCTAKPPEKPIVLRPHPVERRVVHRPNSPKPAAPQPGSADVLMTPAEAAGAAATHPADIGLSASEKEDLFRRFDSYLSRPQPARAQPGTVLTAP